MYGCTAFPWIGPGRTSATWTVMSSRFAGFVRSRLCICARLSIWNVPTVSARWMSSYTASSSSGMRERSIVSSCVRAICSTQSSTAESIPRPRRSILRKPASRQVLVPLAELAACHGRRLHGDELDQRPRRHDHPARVLRDVTREARNLSGEPGEGAPALRLELPVTVREPRDLLPHASRSSRRTAVRAARLGEREAERLPDVADGAARAVRREARNERGVIAPVALGHADDELLADVAREVEVDVRDRGQLAVEEAPERRLVRHRIDVREPGEVADDRAHGAPRPRPGREKARGESVPRTSRAHTRAISSTSWWSRKNPASPGTSMSASSLSRRASACVRRARHISPYGGTWQIAAS